MVIAIAGGVLFFALIIVSVLLHELGHLIPAKLFGVKVTQYFAGFGKTLWSTRRGETEYGFKLIPAGGYCRLIGMYPPRSPHAKNTWLQRVADGAREAEYEEITPADDGRLFYQKKTWQKLLVMAGGILTNLLLAFLLFWGVYGIHGATESTTTVASVQECLIPANRSAQTCLSTDPETPAAQAGLRAGDRIVEVNGTAIRSWDQLSTLIRDNADREFRVVVDRGGSRVDLVPVHTVITGVQDRLDPSKTVQAGYFGFSAATVVAHYGPGETLAKMAEISGQALTALAILPIKVFNVVVDIVQGHPRDPNSPMSIVGASRVAGDVAASNLALGDKVAVGASLLGGLNLFLFWFNVIPLPPMDGGHIAGALWEWVKRRGAKLLGRPDPGPVDTAKMLPLVYVVGGLLVVLGAVLIVADIISPVRLF